MEHKASGVHVLGVRAYALRKSRTILVTLITPIFEGVRVRPEGTLPVQKIQRLLFC